MRFAQLLRAVAAGTLKQLPIMGPVIEELLREYAQAETDRRREQSQAEFEQRVVDLIREVIEGRSPLAGTVPNLMPALQEAAAEAEGRLERRANRSAGRYLYLASDNYAGAGRTYGIAAENGFLWRSFFNLVGKPIAHVSALRPGDVIALAYLVGGGQFRVLLPVVVTEHNSFTRPLDRQPFVGRPRDASDAVQLRNEKRTFTAAEAVGFRGTDYGPFAEAVPELATTLRDNNYAPDPVYSLFAGRDVFVGLPVKPLFTDVSTTEASAILHGEFVKPTGNNSLWVHDFHNQATGNRVPATVTNWIAGLGTWPSDIH